jgi:hypothetical protein
VDGKVRPIGNKYKYLLWSNTALHSVLNCGFSLSILRKNREADRKETT